MNTPIQGLTFLILCYNTSMHSIHIRHFDTVTSTNDLLKEAAFSGAPDGTLYIADAQTAGRGRMGRSFYSPDSTGLYMSLLLRGDVSRWDSHWLTPGVAVAAAETLDRRYGVETGIKWVNDLYLGGRKVTGILCEGISADGIPCVVIGIGINLSTSVWPGDIASKAGSVSSVAPTLEDRLSLAREIAERLLCLLEGENSRIRGEYRRRSILDGLTVDVLPVAGGSAAYSAVVEGIDDDANLIVRCENGGQKRLFSGEVSVRVP